MTTRRAILKLGVGAAVGATAGRLASSPPLTATELVPESAAVVAPASPYATYPWKWWISTDDESFFEWFETKEDAIKAAESYGDQMFVAECQHQDFSLDIDGDQIFSLLYDNNEELVGEGEFVSCSDEQVQELGVMVTSAIEAWAVKNKIDLQAWTFGATRNRITISELVGPVLPPSRMPI